ncbi:DUF3078 domain-containing protein [Flavobacterium algicola]|uniref:DUF3078 domain-containing protein n=1 Tax=Flavobacterium algicola TaxID=556529 RepID=UPI001EFCB4F4|nr:DUF3078 domain-containing protein [Flavobacterium algicola]MCG9794091.1 DUF3078 domain-containing protein [Flavobacterium algicola]
MKLIHITLLCLIITTSAFSQKIITSLNPIPVKVDSISHWEKKNIIGFTISEILFVNWNAGGTNSISGLLRTQFNRNYSNDNTKWANELIMRYGLNKQDGISVRKTDDAFQFTSTFGYRENTNSNWYHSAKFNFNTQFSNGYSYPNTEISVSGPFAPAYSFLGVGAEYASEKKDRLFYFSPFTSKVTYVGNQRLADKGSFGVPKAIYDEDGNLVKHGEKVKSELGTLITAYHKQKVAKNITLENRLSLYSDYINKYGNVDIDYELAFDLVVNQYVKTNIGMHIIYDDDIKAKDEINGEQVTVGPKTQLKQVLGVGMTYSF